MQIQRIGFPTFFFGFWLRPKIFGFPHLQVDAAEASTLRRLQAIQEQKKSMGTKTGGYPVIDSKKAVKTTDALMQTKREHALPSEVQESQELKEWQQIKD